MITVNQGEQVTDGINGGKDGADTGNHRAGGLYGIPANGIVGQFAQPLVELFLARINVIF
ncbi:hypothetical protein D3C78_1034790 [compost metagenome]